MNLRVIEDNINNILNRQAEKTFMCDLEVPPSMGTFVTIDVDLGEYSFDIQTGIDYENKKQMKLEIQRMLKTMWTEDLLEYFRIGAIKNLTFRIGPENLSGLDLYEENGLSNHK